MGARKKSSKKRYGKKAASKVQRAMHEMKSGTARSSRSKKKKKKKVKSRKQAIAIGLSEARRAGGKVPARKKPRTRARKKQNGRSKGAA